MEGGGRRAGRGTKTCWATKDNRLRAATKGEQGDLRDDQRGDADGREELQTARRVERLAEMTRSRAARDGTSVYCKGKHKSM